MAKGYIVPNDFIELRNAIHNELSRRGIGVPSGGFAVQPAAGGLVIPDHIWQTYNNILAISGTDWRNKGASGVMIMTSDITQAINYTKTLMVQNIKA